MSSSFGVTSTLCPLASFAWHLWGVWLLNLSDLNATDYDAFNKEDNYSHNPTLLHGTINLHFDSETPRGRNYTPCLCMKWWWIGDWVRLVLLPPCRPKPFLHNEVPKLSVTIMGRRGMLQKMKSSSQHNRTDKLLELHEYGFPTSTCIITHDCSSTLVPQGLLLIFMVTLEVRTAFLWETGPFLSGAVSQASFQTHVNADIIVALRYFPHY